MAVQDVAVSEISDGGARVGAADLLTRVVSALAALLVVAEMLILFAGVVSRYVFQRPFVWSDELASLLFIWLAILGSVLALQRGQHMQLTTLISRLPPRARLLCKAVGEATIVLFALILLRPADDYMLDEAFIRTPALGLSGALRAASIETGLALMLVVGCVRLFARDDRRHALLGLALVGGVALAFWLAQPVFAAIGNWSLLVFFVGLLAAAVVIGVPIGFAFGVATIGYLALASGAPLTVIVGRLDEGMSHFILLSVPLFVFLGLLIEMTGLARALVEFLASLLGSVRGGLSYVLLGAMVLVSGISGSKAADMAALAPVLFPEMRKRGIPPGELIAQLAASGAMSETIPPSLVLITIGSVTGVSIAALFTGGLLPAGILALALMAVCYFRSRNDDVSGAPPIDWRRSARLFVIALPALALPVIIRSAVVEGIATATEVSTIGVFFTLLIGIFLYRQFDWRRIYPMLVDTASLSGAILFIVGTATAMAWALTQSGFSHDLASLMARVYGGAAGFMAISIVAFIILGSLLEGIPAIVLFGPLLFPIAKSFGIHEVHYAVVTILSMGVGLFAPPFGIGYYTACAIGRIDPNEGLEAIWPYLAALIAGIAVIAAFPWLSIGFL